MVRQTVLSREIAQQPEALAQLLRTAGDSIGDAAARILAFEPEVVVIAARGSSDNAARYAQYLLGAFQGYVVSLATPSLFTLYRRPPQLRRALAIGLSQSGQSPDVVAVLQEARRQGGFALAITNDPASPLAQAADSHIALGMAPEQSVAATKTYTGLLLVLAMLSAQLGGEACRLEAPQCIPSAVRAVLEQWSTITSGVQAYGKYYAFVVLGRGYNYSTAFEIALKMKEVSRVVAEAHSMADLMHGPVAMLDEKVPAVLVAPTGAGADDSPLLLARLQQLGVKTIVISDRSALLGGADLPIVVPRVPEWLSPVVAVVPGQILAFELALARGYDPDHPRGLSKVTRTR